jgi:Rap1a immunity proteins
MRALIIGIATALVLANSALAQEQDKFSANSMLPYCRAAVNNQAPALTSDAIMQGMCVGIVDAIDFMMSEFPPDEKDFSSCLPTDVTLKQAVQAVIAYIDARPEQMNENFKKLAIEAIHEAWPCGTN